MPEKWRRTIFDRYVKENVEETCEPATKMLALVLDLAVRL